MEQTSSSSQVSSSLPSQGKKIPFNIKARSEVLALILAGLLVVTGGVYYFMQKVNKRVEPIIITKEEYAQFLKQVNDKPNPKFTDKEQMIFQEQTSKTPNPQISEEELARFMDQVNNGRPVIIQ